MKVIGITGKTGSGKTKFASLLAKKINCQHIIVDLIGHEALFNPKILNDLCDKFGKGILDKSGKIDRKKVGEIVFAQKDKMQELTDLTWGYMKKELNSILSQDEKFVILDWVLLPDTEYWDKCDFKILINSENIERKNKVLERDNISEEYFQKRELAGVDYSRFKFDYIFKNNYQIDTINESVARVINKIEKEVWNNNHTFF